MKILFYSLFISLLFTGSALPKGDVDSYVIKIKPIGISEKPRYTIYIGLTKIMLTEEDRESGGLFKKEILTDKNSLLTTLDCIKKYKPKKSSATTEDFGSLEVSVFNGKSVLTKYALVPTQSSSLLRLLISTLRNKGLDSKLINTLHRDGFNRIP